MTARLGQPGEEPELDPYDLISRARAQLPALATEELDRIRALLERALREAGGGDAAEVVAELARTLAHGA